METIEDRERGKKKKKKGRLGKTDKRAGVRKKRKQTSWELETPHAPLLWGLHSRNLPF